MEEKKKNITNFLKTNGRLAILILFFVELFLTIFITPNKYDDADFIEHITNTSISSYVISRYSVWTSRIIIEYVLCFVLKTSKYLWVFIEALMVALTGYSISKLFIKNNKNELNWILIFMIFLYPIDVMASAGWAATTVNYVWPLATGLFALIPIKKIWDGEKIKPYQYILYSISLLFSANQEQTSALLLGSYLLFTVLFIIRDKKINLYIIVQDLIIIASFIFIVTCPGNYSRNAVEISRHFKDLNMLSFLDKISLGFTSTIGIIIGEGNVIYAMLTFIIVVYIFTNYKETLYRVIAFIPFGAEILLHFGIGTLGQFFPYLGSFKEFILQEQEFLTPATSNNFLYTIPIIFSFINFICIGLSILLIFKNIKNNIAIIVYIAGLASRIVMGFSPTVFISGQRTMIFFEFAMIIVSILIWQNLSDKENKSDKKIVKRVEAIIKCAGVLQVCNCLLCILLTQK